MEYFVNTIDVVQNIKKYVPLIFIYSLLFPLYSLKINTLGCIFVNILPNV